MDRWLDESVQRLVEAWAKLTAGSLAVHGEGTSVPGEAPRAGYPLPVRRALENRLSLEAHRVSRRFWWVTAPDPAEPRGLQIVAWAPEDRGWGALLCAWSALLSHLAEVSATAAGLTSELINAWDRLTFLYDLAKIAGRHTDLREMLDAIVRLLAQVVSVQDVVLVATQPEGLASFTSSGKGVPLPEVLVECVAEAKRPLALEEVRPVLERGGSPLAWSGDLLVTPLQGPGGRGALCLVNPPNDRFDAHDVQLLASVGEQVNALIEAAETRAQREKSQRLEHELEIAAHLQSSLLPLRLPEVANMRAAAYLRPARRVGGDFYDAVTSGTGGMLLLLADVAGKGMPAALLTALVHAVFISEAADRTDPGEVLQVMNRRMFSDLDRAETFITAVVIGLEPHAPHLTYASAGHVDVAIWRGAEERIEFLPASGLPLGVEREASYRARNVPLHAGDEVILYSDGVTEAEGPNGALFGSEGLSAIISATFSAPAVEQLRAIVDGLDVHRADRPLRDDVTLLLVKVGAENGDTVLPFVLPARREAVVELLERVRQVIGSHSFGGRPAEAHFSDEFVLALSEIVTNQVQHAYLGQGGRIEGTLTISEDEVVADLFDHGVLFDQPEADRAAVDPANPPERGYGLRLARALLDECCYTRIADGRNHWRLVKHVKGAATL
jgi:serine phosphatase RsbU (regulator of sigma subunit)/anti-sigma regulatory factor (Ser/Thr protein kinase)